MRGFVILQGPVFLARSEGPGLDHRAFLAVHYPDRVHAGHVDKKSRSRLLNGHGFKPVRIELHLRKLFAAPGIHDADQTVWRMSLAAAVHDVKIFRCGVSYTMGSASIVNSVRLTNW